MASTTTMLVTFFSIMLVVMVLFIFPHVEGILMYTGEQIETNTGYNVDQEEADNARAGLWAAMVVLVTMAGFAALFVERRVGH